MAMAIASGASASPSGSPSSTSGSSASTSDNADKNPLNSQLEEVFEMPSLGRDDHSIPCINIMHIADDKRLYMIDFANMLLKVMPLESPREIRTVPLEVIPFRVASLPNGDLVMTTMYKFLLFLVDGRQKRVETTRTYIGLSIGPDHTLIVSCRRDNIGLGSVDLLQFDGSFIRTIVSETTLGSSVNIVHLYATRTRLLMGDRKHKSIHRVSIFSGLLMDTVSHPELVSCVQAYQDDNGFLYCLIIRKPYLLVRTPQGDWRYILTDVKYRKDDDHILGIQFNKSGRVVVSWHINADGMCAIKGYKWI